MLPNQLQAVLFDFDSTLQTGDKEEAAARFREIVKRMGTNLSDAEVEEIVSRSDYREMRTMVVAEHNKRHPEDPKTEDDFNEINKGVSGTMDHHFTLKQGAVELLELIKKHGLKIGLVTTRGSNSLPRLLKLHGITDYFDVIINRDDCHHRKPHPQPLITALEKIAIEPENAVYIGDKQEDDIIAGNCIGMTTVWINHKELDPYCAKPNFHIKKLDELIPVLEAALQ